ncbi:MAG: methyltransferase domain-containing protein [Gimesia chilikensis]
MQTSNKPDRFLIYVVAYEAEQHLFDLFERIPFMLFNRDDVHFLVNDDASADNGALILKKWLVAHDIYNVTILKNRINQGYGGNQKIGFRAAIDDEYSCVILLHGDGQYAPELLPEFIETWKATRPDVILGSRMHSTRSARAGGMPWYKLVGNRILTRFQNWLTGWSLSEYHTGYRAYSTKFLQSVPFEINTNDFHFDTEILLQAAHVKASVQEIDIPTFYGNEICRVQGFKYAWNVVTATIQYKMHQWGMLCSLKLRNLSTDRYRDKTQAEYSSHALALKLLKARHAQNVLDIGCGPGHVASQCEQQGMQVTGVDCSRPQSEVMSRFIFADLERDEIPVSLTDYDTMLMLDVIEHLAHPEEFLLALRNEHRTDAGSNQMGNIENVASAHCNEVISDGYNEDEQNSLGTPQVLSDPPALPLLLLSTPNVAFAAVRLNLLFGRFNYAERGILDITHKRLFTRRTLLRMLEDCGYNVERVHAIGAPFSAVMPGRLGKWLGWMAGLLAKAWPAMFAFQFMVECRPRPGVRESLKNALRVHEHPTHVSTPEFDVSHQSGRQDFFE